MRIDIQFAGRATRKDLPIAPRIIQELLRKTVRELKSEPEWKETVGILGEAGNLAVLFCDDDIMRNYQKRYRKLDRTTDILSFPARELVAGASAKTHRENSFASILDAEILAELSLGDLIVSMETVTRGARRARRKPADELGEVLVHGVLHLVGLDHVKVSPARARRMKSLQKKLYERIRPTIAKT